MNLFKRLNKKRVYFPLAAFIITLVFTILIWNDLAKSHELLIKENLVQIGKSTSEKFQSILNYDIEGLENLKNRLEFTNGSHFEYWEKDAQLLLEQNPSFHFIEWIDSNMIIRNIVPLNENKGALNLDISKIGYRNIEWKEHAKNDVINITPWSKMTQGGYAFLIDVPVNLDGEFQGTITAGMDFSDHLNSFAEELNQYEIELRDYEGTLFYDYNAQTSDKASSNVDFVYEETILIDKLHSKYWSFKMYPTDALFLNDRSFFIKYFLGTGIFLALLIASLIYFYFRAKDEVLRTTETNKALLRSNKKLNKEQKKAKKASRVKTEFLSNMSHEIRTPLHAILGFVQILKSSKLNDTDKNNIDLLDASSKSLLSIVNDILTIDKIESGTIQLEESYFNPSQKIQELTNTYSHLFSEKGLYIQSNFKEPFGVNVLGDQNKLSQIFINIIKNASKFTVEGGVTISYREKQKDNQLNVNITIEDTGIGIPKSKLNTIFDRFAQIDSSLKKQHEGSGLGLAISKDLATKLGGTILVHRNQNQGSKFEISVVFEVAKNHSVFGIKETYKNLDLSHLTALIVDDNKINIVILKKILEDVNIKVDTALNGKVALEKIKTRHYNMVFMDIHMPEMDGFEATKRVRKFNTELKIFGLSANVTSEAIEKAFDCGMNNYISKPFTKEQLYNLILINLEYNELRPDTALHNIYSEDTLIKLYGKSPK
jgi:signal transduction histidine kinase/FixJ family two-component response regulator